MLLFVKTFGNTWTVSQPGPFLFCPSLVKCALTLFSLTAVSFGIKAVRENCCFALWGTSHTSCLPCFWGVLTRLLHFTSNGLPAMFPGYATLSLTFLLASSHLDQNVLCAFIFPRIKRDGSYWRSPTKKPPPSRQLKAAFQILDVFAKKK